MTALCRLTLPRFGRFPAVETPVWVNPDRVNYVVPAYDRDGNVIGSRLLFAFSGESEDDTLMVLEPPEQVLRRMVDHNPTHSYGERP